MQETVGYLLIAVGLAMIVLGVLAWVGVIPTNRDRSAGVWDFLIELLKRAPWVVVVGLILIYIGAKMLGVALPP
jgi:uncharacterized membrane protein